MSFIDKFRRVTSNGDYFPEIDGLRFIAIITVIFFHMKVTVQMLRQNIGFFGNLIKPIFDNGWQGVELFFAISGFIIGLPFAKQYIDNQKPVNLKNYFLRRLTRLEPPYMVAIIGYTLIAVFLNIDNPEQKLKGLISSIFYLNNIVYNIPEYYPIGVVWSLEIEIQFYILAILFAKIYKLKKILRRAILLIVIYTMPLLHLLITIKKPTLYTFLHFFFIGLLLADLYIDKNKFKINKTLAIIIGSIALFALLYISHGKSLINKYIFINAIIIFYYLTMHNEFWKKLMSTKIIAIIGGMCYSIYLIHTIIIGLYQHFTYGMIIADSYMITLLINTFFASFIIISMSGIYFILIEKPCMNKNWISNLGFFIKDKFLLIIPNKFSINKIND